ncbi:MAG TPA: TonB family protein [Methylocystis sp.]|nr:TonB family protein [Methylocystis sp.]
MADESRAKVGPLRARPQERFLRLEKAARGPFLALLAMAFVLHAALLAGLLIEQWTNAELAPPEQEVAVEVVPEVPKPEEPPPPPPQAQAQQPPMPLFERFERTIHRHEEADTSQQKLKLDDKIATDAPRAEKENPLKRDAPDDETKSQRVEQPTQERSAVEPEQQQRQKAQAEQAPEASPEEQATAPKLENKSDQRDAEVIQQAAPKLGEANDKKGTKPRVRAVQGEEQKSISQIVASLTPTPEFKSAGRSHGAPITGGTAESEYKSVVLGLIMRRLAPPGHAKPFMPPAFGIYLDQEGRLTHCAILQSSGDASFDQSVVSAIRRAAPFPATPTGTSVNLYLDFAKGPR